MYMYEAVPITITVFKFNPITLLTHMNPTTPTVMQQYSTIHNDIAPPSQLSPPPPPPSTATTPPHRSFLHHSFYWSKTAHFLFPGWPGSNAGMYGLSLIFVFAIAVLAEFLSRNRLIKSGSNSVASCFFRTGLYCIRAGFVYMVMLAVVSYNAGVFIAAVLGHGVGYAIFGSGILGKSDGR